MRDDGTSVGRDDGLIVDVEVGLIVGDVVLGLIVEDMVDGLHEGALDGVRVVDCDVGL